VDITHKVPPSYDKLPIKVSIIDIRKIISLLSCTNLSDLHFLGKQPSLTVIMCFLGVPSKRLRCNLRKYPFLWIAFIGFALKNYFIINFSGDESLDKSLEGREPSATSSINLGHKT
jgi:hypothetical protein